MAIPPIEMRWGGGKWPGSYKRAARPTMQAALSLSVDGLEYLSVETSVPKCAVVWLAGKSFPDDGGNDNDREFEVYLPYVAVKRRKLQPWLGNITVSSVHEFLHSVREETADDTRTLFGLAADEGIANLGEYIVAEALFGQEDLEALYPSLSFAADTGVEQRLRDALTQDMDQLARMDSEERVEYEDQLKEAWFSPSLPKDLSAGEVLGVCAIQRFTSEGATIGEIVRMPTATIFGIDQDIIAA